MTMHQMLLAMGGPLAFDAVSSAEDVDRDGSLTFSHTCSGANRALIVSVAHFGDEVNGPVQSVTYGGVGLTLIGRILPANHTNAEQWKLSNPASGANNVVVTMLSTGANMFAGAVSFTGANQVTANLTGTQATAEGTNDTPSVNVASASNEIVIDVECSNDDLGGAHTATAGAGQTERWGFELTDTGTFMGSTEVGAASVTMSWTLTGNTADWAIAGVSVKPA